MKIATLLLLILSTAAYGEPLSTPTLPIAPTASQLRTVHVFHALDWSLVAVTVAANAYDFTSTRACIARPAGTCREAILPTALVHNAPGFAAYKLGVTSLELIGQYELSRHGHRRIARIAQTVNIGLSFRTDSHNTILAAGPNPHLRPIRPVAH